MKRSRQDAAANRFNELDFHDDGLLSIKILPLAPRLISRKSGLNSKTTRPAPQSCSPLLLVRTFVSTQISMFWRITGTTRTRKVRRQRPTLRKCGNSSWRKCHTGGQPTCPLSPRTNQSKRNLKTFGAISGFESHSSAAQRKYWLRITSLKVKPSPFPRAPQRILSTRCPRPSPHRPLAASHPAPAA